jgi:hypothetical protein
MCYYRTMNDTVFVAITGGISGLITGAIGSLVAPWVNWGIEKRRKKQERRRELIDRARLLLDGKALRREDYRQSAEYGAITVYLSQKIRDRVNQRNTSGGEENIRDEMSQEFNALEKKWGLL